MSDSYDFFAEEEPKQQKLETTFVGSSPPDDKIPSNYDFFAESETD